MALDKVMGFNGWKNFEQLYWSSVLNHAQVSCSQNVYSSQYIPAAAATTGFSKAQKAEHL